MKLLVITQIYDSNDSNLGAFIDWWDRLAEKVEKIYMLALEKKSEPTKSNMEVISMGKELGRGFFGKTFGFYSGLLKTIGKTDAILVHMIPKYAMLAAPIAFIYRKPMYMWYTGVSVHWQLKLAVKFCKKVFTAHEAAMRVHTPKRIITGHGIDVLKFRMRDSGFKSDASVTILSVGRITPSKGHDLVIKVVSDLIKSGYDLTLKIIGGVVQDYHKKYLESLKKLASDLTINEKVEFSGPISSSNMPDYMGNSEILINAVPFGGLDKVTLEAMSSGVIPLTSNSAFLTVFPPQVREDLVFKSGDSEDLKNKLKNILDKKMYEDEIIRWELRDSIIKNHNLDTLIERMFKEMNT